MKRDYSKHLRRFHEAKWDEELIFDLSVPGQRGVNVTKPSPRITEEVGDGADDIPPCMRRKTPLPRSCLRYTRPGSTATICV